MNGELKACREAFEHWFSDEGKSPRAVARKGDDYELMQAHSAWIAWQAAWSARPTPAPGALPELVKEMRESLEGVVRVADRNTDEFERARAAIAKAAPLSLANDGSCEAQFIADSDRLNCPACGGSGHVDDARAYAEQCRAGVVVTDEVVRRVMNYVPEGMKDYHRIGCKYSTSFVRAALQSAFADDEGVKRG